MKEIVNEKIIKESLIKKTNGIKSYLYLMEKLHTCNVSKDVDFIKKYKNFYKMNMARLSKEFYDVYFEYLEENKSKIDSINFKDILVYLFKSNTSNRIEASFSSKLLATINPNMPVWDKNVLSQLGIQGPKIRKDDKEEQLKDAVKIYDELANKLHDNYLKTDIGKEYIRVFDETFKNDFSIEKITPIKKIDFVLWSLGEKN